MLHNLVKPPQWIQQFIGSYLKGLRSVANTYELVVGLGLSSLGVNLLGLVLPLVLLQVYDRIIPNAATGTLSFLFLMVLVAIVFEILLTTARSVTTAWIDARLEHKLGTAAFNKVISARLKDFEKDGSGMHLERLTAFGALKNFYTGQAMISLFDLPFIIIFLILIAYIANWLAWVPISILCFHLYSAYRHTFRLRERLEQLRSVDDRRINFIIELITGIHVVKTFSMESQFLRRYERLQENSTKINESLNIQAGKISANNQFFSQLALVCTVSVGGIMVSQGDLTAGGLAACTLLTGRILQPANKLAEVWKRFQSIVIAENKLNEVLDMQSESKDTLKEFPKVLGNIRLEDIEHGDTAYRGFLFSSLNLEVKAGDLIGITGSVSSGKSTLLSIIGGMLSPNRGSVYIDDRNISQYSIEEYRKQVALLSTNAVLFKGTILENLTLFRNGTHREKAMKISDDLGITETIHRLPNGFNTLIGHQAVGMLPKGLRQRIGIARGLVNDPSIILFDEANAGIDMPSDQLVKDVILKLKGEKTIIFVTHRPSFLQMADRQYKLENGFLAPIIS